MNSLNPDGAFIEDLEYSVSSLLSSDVASFGPSVGSSICSSLSPSNVVAVFYPDSFFNQTPCK